MHAVANRNGDAQQNALAVGYADRDADAVGIALALCLQVGLSERDAECIADELGHQIAVAEPHTDTEPFRFAHPEQHRHANAEQLSRPYSQRELDADAVALWYDVTG